MLANLIYIVFFSGASGLKKLQFELPVYDTPLSQAMADVFVNFYEVREAVVHIFRESSNVTTYIQDSDIVNEVLHKLDADVVISLDNEEELEKVERKRIYNVIVVDCYDSFYRVYEKIDPKHFDFQGFYLVVLTYPLKDHYMIVKQIFKDFWVDYIVNINVIATPDAASDEAFMYTYYPYSKFLCGKARPFMVARYGKEKLLFRPDYFPDKVENLHRCPLRVAIYETPPFMIVNKGRARISVDGVDALLMKYIAEKMNFRPVYKLSDEQGHIFENGSATGAFGMVKNLDANLTIGFIIKTADRDKLMTPSYFYYTSKLVWVVPPGRQYTSFEKLFKPFKYKLWTVVSITFLLSNLLIFIWRFKFKNSWNFAIGGHMRTPYLDVFNALFGGVMNAEPLKNFGRFLLMVYMLYALVIRGAYQGALFQFLQKDTNAPQVQTIGEIIDHNYSFYMIGAAESLFQTIPEVRSRCVSN